MYDSMRKATTAKISSHVCSARKSMASPAALKRNERIEPRSPGRSEACFLPISFSPFPNALPVAFKALVIVPMTAPIMKPAARRIAINDTPWFLKMSLIFSRRGFSRSIPSICVVNCPFSSSRCPTRPSTAVFSEGEVFSSLITALSSAFSHSSSAFCSFSSLRASVSILFFFFFFFFSIFS